MESTPTEIVFTTLQIVIKEFYTNLIQGYADPYIQELVGGLNFGSVLCIFSVIYDEETPHTILWLVLYEGKYLPIETPYSREIIAGFKRENCGFDLEQCCAVELADLPSIIWRKFLGVIKCVPIYQATKLGEGGEERGEEFKTIEVVRTLIFVASGRCYPMTYTVECKNDGLDDTLIITKNCDGAISEVEGKVLVSERGGRKMFKVVESEYSINAGGERKERFVSPTDLTTRQIRVITRGGEEGTECPNQYRTMYFIPSCSDGQFRKGQKAWKECAGSVEEIQGKIIVVGNTIKIVGENRGVNVLDDEYEILDAIQQEFYTF